MKTSSDTSNKAKSSPRNQQSQSKRASESLAKPGSDRPENATPGPRESLALSSESQNNRDTAPREGLVSLLDGMSDWATGNDQESSPDEQSITLDLAEGELLGQSRSSNPQQVSQLQEMLNARGHQLEVDGQFGPLTAEAVRAVQRELGVTVDGIVGPETMAALNGGGDRSESDGFPEVIETPDVQPSPGGQGLEGLPPRSEGARGGQEFMSSIEHMRPGPERNQAILNEILSGNIPENSRTLQNITVNRDGREISMSVMPDYLAIGSNEDNVRVPMTPEVAQAIADRTGMSLPTDRIVDDIHGQARQLHLDPLGASSQMSSIAWYGNHDDRIDRQLGSGVAPTELVSGHKKDLVIPARDGRVAIYGGRWSDGRRVQSYSNVHHQGYEDYSHGVRLVSQEITVDGQRMRLADVLNDPSLRALFTSQSGRFRYN